MIFRRSPLHGRQLIKTDENVGLRIRDWLLEMNRRVVFPCCIDYTFDGFTKRRRDNRLILYMYILEQLELINCSIRWMVADSTD